MSEIMHTLAIDPRVMAAQVTGFVLLWIILAKYLFRPMLGVFDERREQLKETFAKANAEKEKAEEYRAEYEKRWAEVEAEARVRIQEAVKDGETSKAQIIAEARGRSEDILRRGQEQLDRERDKTLAEMREEVVDISLSAASKLIGESMDDAKHRKLISEYVDKIGVAE